MNDTASAPLQQDGVPPVTEQGGHGHGGSRTALAVGAIGVVFGDIGTSPLYAFRETFAGAASIAIDRLHFLVDAGRRGDPVCHHSDACGQ
jgi:KUP system potassium uptake protein